MAALVRPGGVIVAEEPLASPTWRSAPPFDDDAIRREWEIVHQTMAASGAQPDAVDSLAASAREAGLEILTLAGSFSVIDGASGFDLHAATLTAVKDRAVALGVAEASEIDELAARFREQVDGPYDWVSSPIYLDAAFRKSEKPLEERAASVQEYFQTWATLGWFCRPQQKKAASA